MQAGNLNRRIFIQETAQTKDTFNNTQDAFAPWSEDLAEFQTLGADSFHANWKRYAETTARFHIRFRQDIDPALHQIILFDDFFSPAAQSTWTITGKPYDLTGKMRELYIEVSEVKGTA